MSLGGAMPDATIRNKIGKYDMTDLSNITKENNKNKYYEYTKFLCNLVYEKSIRNRNKFSYLKCKEIYELSIKLGLVVKLEEKYSVKMYKSLDFIKSKYSHQMTYNQYITIISNAVAILYTSKLDFYYEIL